MMAMYASMKSHKPVITPPASVYSSLQRQQLDRSLGMASVKVEGQGQIRRRDEDWFRCEEWG